MNLILSVEKLTEIFKIFYMQQYGDSATISNAYAENPEVDKSWPNTFSTKVIRHECGLHESRWHKPKWIVEGFRMIGGVEVDFRHDLYIPDIIAIVDAIVLSYSEKKLVVKGCGISNIMGELILQIKEKKRSIFTGRAKERDEQAKEVDRILSSVGPHETFCSDDEKLVDGHNPN